MPDSPFNPNARPAFPWPGDMTHVFDPDAPPGVLAAGLPAPEPPAPEPPAPEPPAPAPPSAPVQLDRYGRTPVDVRAMLTERARQQYERRFGGPGANTASMRSQGEQEQLDALIARLSGGNMRRMNAMRRY